MLTKFCWVRGHLQAPTAALFRAVRNATGPRAPQVLLAGVPYAKCQHDEWAEVGLRFCGICAYRSEKSGLWIVLLKSFMYTKALKQALA